jgi:hypothetical protein
MYKSSKTFIKMNSTSQSGQDILVSKLIKTQNPTFVDIGCWHPNVLNNTNLLEELGWTGISLDIQDMSQDWLIRKTKFICADALKTNYMELFNENNLPLVIDYLSVDIEGDGLRFLALQKVLESNREFKIITIEHDSYRGYDLSEKIPQRELLYSRGYFLLCSDVCLGGNPFEDWWINPKFFSEDEYNHLKSHNIEFNEILKKFEI